MKMLVLRADVLVPHVGGAPLLADLKETGLDLRDAWHTVWSTVASHVDGGAAAMTVVWWAPVPVEVEDTALAS